MQVKLFFIPFFDDGSMQDTLNKFLRGHKVLALEQNFVQHASGVGWAFSVKYHDGVLSFGKTGHKVDYKEILTEEAFQRFNKLRGLRKQMAIEEGLPAYAVFTDDELAQMAQMDVLSIANARGIKGIGDKKVEKYLVRLLEEFQQV